MICSSVNRFRFICPSFNRGRTLTPGGGKTQWQVTVKEAAGKATGNRQMEAEGAVEKTAGKVQKGFGNAKQKIKDSL
jgi:uncharacterized protein YjbJ (UPF0337 family)